ncbi:MULTISPECIES: ABC transporter substrate-binding protein [unclassified Clostridium]|uniref:ABC transporter substrate-binding protein n=1 Tax=unclassified Clostridium TaxID=2614128 RepID=UPI00029849ED|nr:MULTISPECIES: ABC transporter substrate-binding protein [unclassified Clostridium]EKQ58036.1 MAG: periplasmic component of amino acid ABC-type transporter/signal transduction system [Clostridium sp. Maddingley MBC34-26]
MKRITQRLLIFIIILNFIGIGMILEGNSRVDSSKTTTINITKEKNRLETIKEKGEITVVSPLNDVTYFYFDNNTNKISGIDADIIGEITSRLEINKVEMKIAPFSDLLEKLNTDDSIDISAGGIYITPKREELVSFTQPLYKGSEAIVVPTYSSINFKNDLKNSVVGVEKGTVFLEMAKRWKENKLIKDIAIFNTSADLLNAINNNKIDAGIVDSIIVKYSLMKDKNLLVRMLKDYNPEITGNVGIAVRKNDTELLNALNRKISDMKADGTLYAILVTNGLNKDNMISN